MSAIHFLAVILLAVFFINFAECKEIEIWNRRQALTWVGAHATKGFKLPNGGGWALKKNKKVTITVPDDWQGRFWPRTFCNITRDNQCETGGCGKNFQCRGKAPTPPATTIEFRFTSGDFDQYSVSLVNGFNTIVTVEPTGSDGRNCKRVTCNYPWIKYCPKELQKDFNGVYVSGCYSPCHALKSDEYCCKGEYSGAENCDPTFWETNYAKLFKDKCPDVKTYLHDNENVWHACKAAKYSIVLEEGNP